MTTPRLFPDYAALPTAHDRALMRTNNERHQLDMFDTHPMMTADGMFDTEPEPCPVCAGDHPEADCDYGSAPTLPDTNDARRDEHAARLERREADRLTDTDRAAIAAAIAAAIRHNDGTWTWAGMPTLERIAWHAIGCDARDLRGSELLWIEHECRRAIAGIRNTNPTTEES